METLALDASDNDLRAAVRRWFDLLASGAIEDASSFLNWDHPDECMPVVEFPIVMIIRVYVVVIGTSPFRFLLPC